MSCTEIRIGFCRIDAAGVRTAKLTKGSRMVVIKGGQPAIIWTHAEDVNAELLAFLAKGRKLDATATSRI